MNDVRAAMGRSGLGYVTQANHPAPVGDVAGEYAVPVLMGRRGYRTRDGRFHPI